MKSSSKQWIHSPDQLTKGQIAYNVKFLGECSVEQPKGTEMVKDAIRKMKVTALLLMLLLLTGAMAEWLRRRTSNPEGTEVIKDAIRKMKFNRHLKRAEGLKPPKVQLMVCVDGVSIQDPKSKAILHEYPLHRISYCADDKSDKQMFTFIAKAATTNDHYCYVFKCSEKSAEEITLTVGQAFDLAYKRFLEEGSTAASGGGEMDYKKQCLLLQRRVYALEFENDALKKRVYELEKLKDRSDLEEFMKNNKEPAAPQNEHHQSLVGRRLQNLIFDSDANGEANGKASHSAPQSSAAPILSPPPPTTRHHRQLGGSVTSPVQTSPVSPPHPVSQQAASADVYSSPLSAPGGFGAPASSDPFGMGAFNPPSHPSPTTHPHPPSANGSAAFAASSHLELMDIHAGFTRGLSFGTDDFSLDDLDPLSHRL
ncbi:hypothetical protein ACOMHN_023849 [Nucella lapillus]